LRSRIADLAQQAGMSNPQILEADSSRRSTKLNAYVSGLGPTSRIVIFDTTLRTLNDDEIVAIVGHEMGHYVLHHIWWDFVIGVFGTFFFLWILAWILPRIMNRFVIGRYGPRYGVTALHDLAS